MKKKSFNELLKNNNISSPQTSLDQFFFDTQWKAAKDEYAFYCKEYQTRFDDWEDCRFILQQDWNVLLPDLDEIEPIPQFCFQTPDEAVRVIKDARNKMKTKSILNLQFDQARELRKKWINELVTTADKDTLLIVIKDLSYNPYAKDIETFNIAVSKKQPVGIFIMDTSPIWVAFNPHKELADVQYWTMTKRTSKVTYIK